MKQTPKYTKEELIIILQNYHEEHKTIPKVLELGINKRHFQRHFGSFNKALLEAGLEARYYTNVIKTLTCEHCNSPFEALISTNPKYKKKPPIHCSKKCSMTVLNNQPRSEETKAKIAKALTKNYSRIYTNTCLECHSLFTTPTNRKTCSEDCLGKQKMKIRSKGGRASASKRVKRSKNEIALFDLLSKSFEDCIHNQPIFNGWDADIILPNQKIAVLWNGPWHYTQITKSHSVKQVQNRDRIKLLEIDNYGYKCITIKDHQNNMTPETAYETIISLIDCDGHISIW